MQFAEDVAAHRQCFGRLLQAAGGERAAVNHRLDFDTEAIFVGFDLPQMPRSSTQRTAGDLNGLAQVSSEGAHSPAAGGKIAVRASVQRLLPAAIAAQDPVE